MTLSSQPDTVSRTLLRTDATHGLGEVEIRHPSGSFVLTPASLIALEAIVTHQDLLAGTGLDWGCGAGCLAILAARIAAVQTVIGLDILPANIAASRLNAARNNVAAKTQFMLADSYQPTAASDQANLAHMAGNIDFILANPPSSVGDDGFEFRRIVLAGASSFLRLNGIVFLNISRQYGSERVQRLWQESDGFVHEGILASTVWVPFDLTRPDLLQTLLAYVAEEQHGGFPYTFRHPQQPDIEIDARTALDVFREQGFSPLSQWQCHLFRFVGH